MLDSELIVVGIDGAGERPASPSCLEVSFEALVCSETILELLERSGTGQLRSKWHPITPLQGALETIAAVLEHGRVIVAVGGDPLFFGIGRTLLQHFPERRLAFVPAISSMQRCFARFRLPWDRTEFVSLHGRPMETLLGKLGRPLLFVLTDPRNTPDKIAEFLIQQLGPELVKDFILMVGERLGRSTERLTAGTAGEIGAQRFGQPNCLIIKNRAAQAAAPEHRFGLEEIDIGHSRGLITKSEIRAAVLHSLQLPPYGVFWDLGAGSGSVSIEAARLNPELLVYAVEKNQEQLLHIRANRRRYQCYNMVVKAGEAPEVLEGLPRPDRIFIGGSGGRLDELLRCAVQALTAEGRLVITGVTEHTCRRAPRLLDTLGLTCKTSMISVKRVTESSTGPVIKELNPIQVITARKKHAQ